jgi:hypothetical protein
MHEGLSERAEAWERAINAYGGIIEKDPMTVFPESRLPVAKEEMKTALKSAWIIAEDEQERAIIQIGYSHLSHFRADIAEPIDLEIKLDESHPVEEQVRQFIGQQFKVELMQLVNRDYGELGAEFDAFKATQTEAY